MSFDLALCGVRERRKDKPRELFRALAINTLILFISFILCVCCVCSWPALRPEFFCVNIHVCLWLNSSASFNKYATCWGCKKGRFLSAREVLSLIHKSDFKELQNHETAFLVMLDSRKKKKNVAHRQYRNSREQSPSDNTTAFQRHHVEQDVMLDR